MATLNGNADALTGVLFACLGGKFHIRLDDHQAEPGKRSGKVLDNKGNQIGHASDYLYCGRGFAIDTAPYSGFASCDQVLFV